MCYARRCAAFWTVHNGFVFWDLEVLWPPFATIRRSHHFSGELVEAKSRRSGAHSTPWRPGYNIVPRVFQLNFGWACCPAHSHPTASYCSNERPVTTPYHPGTQIPTQIQEITIMSNDSVTGAPLVLVFQKIFLRPAVLPQSDITFTAEDLSSWEDAF